MSKKRKVVDDVSSASDLLKSDHPLHGLFVRWLEKKGGEPSKRQARRFFQQYPQLRTTVAKAA